jgi:uncharacterized membrane protein
MLTSKAPRRATPFGASRPPKAETMEGQAMLASLALLSGIVAGSRAFTALAAVSWAASQGGLNLAGSWLAFMGSAWTSWIFTALALFELVTDQLPSTPSRKTPPQFGARLASGALSGATLGTSGGFWIGGLVAGVIGALIGTYSGAQARARLAKAFGRDPPAALIEDAAAIVLGLVIVVALT